MTVKGSNGVEWRIRAIALSTIVVLSLGGLALADEVAQAPLKAQAAVEQLVSSGQFASLSDAQVIERLEREGLLSGPDGSFIRQQVTALIKQYRAQALQGTQLAGRDLPEGAGQTRETAIRISPIHRREIWENTGDTSPWAYDESSRSGFYPLPNSDSMTIYSYENDFVFRSGGDQLPRARIADVITFGGTCPMPPEGIYSMEILFGTFGPQTSCNGGTRNGLSCRAAFAATDCPPGPPTTTCDLHGQRVQIRVWDTWNRTAAAGVSVFSNQVGPTIDLDYGTLPAPTNFWIDFLTFSTPHFPTHADNIGIQYDFVDNVTGSLTSSSHWFAIGPAIGPEVSTSLSGPPTGTSENFFYRDANINGILGSDDERFFNTLVTNKANLNLHHGGFPPVGEAPDGNNEDQANADPTCECGNRDGNVSPAADHDWWKLGAGGGRYQIDVDCSPGDDVVLLFRGSVPDPISADADTGLNCDETITTPVLAAGTYFIEVHEKGDDATLAYTLKVKPLAEQSTGFTWNANKTDFTWGAQGTGSTYDVMRGFIDALHLNGGDFSDPSAVEAWDCGLSTPASADPTTPLGPLDSLVYFARVKNSCGGIGSYNEGGGQVGDRDAEIAANPSACP